MYEVYGRKTPRSVIKLIKELEENDTTFIAEEKYSISEIEKWVKDGFAYLGGPNSFDPEGEDEYREVLEDVLFNASWISNHYYAPKIAELGKLIKGI